MGIFGVERLARSKAWLEKGGRPLDRAYLACLVDNKSAVPGLLQCLGAFRNDDGGFSGLEPDWPSPVSSTLCTNRALEMMSEASVAEDHPLVVGALNWLIQSRDTDLAAWRLVPDGKPDHTHAPWWHHEGLAERFNGFAINPTAEVLGYLLKYGGERGSRLAADVADVLFAHLETRTELDMHEVICLNRLLNIRVLDEAAQSSLTMRLEPMVKAAVATSPEDWKGYTLQPLQVVTFPGAVFHDLLKSSIEANLDYLIAEQRDDGSWAPPFSWGDEFPEDAAAATKTWGGILTVENLATLKRFGRLGG